MNQLQVMMDEMSAEWQRQRSATQMTLGKLITRLETLSPETMIGLSEPHSYRGYYSDLAFEPAKSSIKDALVFCRSALGKVFEGYKGGDFQMGENTPVWVAHYGSCGQKIMSIQDDGTLELAEDK